MKFKGAQRGFMLMEVMLATALLGLGLVVIIQSINASLKNSESAANIATASFLLNQKLADVFQARYTSGQEKSCFGTGWENFSWETDCRSLNQNLDEISLSVYWQERNEDKKISVETFVARP